MRRRSGKDGIKSTPRNGRIVTKFLQRRQSDASQSKIRTISNVAGGTFQGFVCGHQCAASSTNKRTSASSNVKSDESDRRGHRAGARYARKDPSGFRTWARRSTSHLMRRTCTRMTSNLLARQQYFQSRTVRLPGGSILDRVRKGTCAHGTWVACFPELSIVGIATAVS